MLNLACQSSSSPCRCTGAQAASSPRCILEGVASGESSSVPLRLLGVVWLEAPPEGGLGGI